MSERLAPGEKPPRGDGILVMIVIPVLGMIGPGVAAAAYKGSFTAMMRVACAMTRIDGAAMALRRRPDVGARGIMPRPAPSWPRVARSAVVIINVQMTSGGVAVPDKCAGTRAEAALCRRAARTLSRSCGLNGTIRSLTGISQLIVLA